MGRLFPAFYHWKGDYKNYLGEKDIYKEDFLMIFKNL